MKRLRNEKLF